MPPSNNSNMISFLFLCIQVLSIAVAVSGFSVGNTLQTRHSRLCAEPSSSCDGQMSDAVAVQSSNQQLQQTIRPVLLSTAAAASIFASLPTVVHANTNNIELHSTTESSSVIVPSAQHSNAMTTSSMQLAASTLESPIIGEVQDGSENSVAKSFGQWFTLLYIVVSLLAGGKEMLKRAQNQLNKDE